jgi:hypothetical protein
VEEFFSGFFFIDKDEKRVIFLIFLWARKWFSFFGRSLKIIVYWKWPVASETVIMELVRLKLFKFNFDYD